MIIVDVSKDNLLAKVGGYKRLMAYYTAFDNEYKYDNEEFEQMWNMFKKMQSIYQRYVIEQKTDVYVEHFFEGIDLLCKIDLEEKIEDQEEVQNILQSVKSAIEKESKHEIKIYSILKEQSQKHPLIAWLIMNVLFSVLLALLGDIVCDGTGFAREEQIQEVVECLKSEEVDAVILQEDGENYIMIKEDE